MIRKSIQSQPFAPGQRGELLVAFPTLQRARGVFMDPPTGARFEISRIDVLSPAELEQLTVASVGVTFAAPSAMAKHGLRIAVHYARCPLAGGAAIFRGQVDLDVDTVAMEAQLGYVVERGVRDAHDAGRRLRRQSN